MAAPVVPFADLSWQWGVIADAIRPEIEELFSRSAFCLGYAVERFERAFTGYLGADHTVGVNSGTSALHLAMLAAGIGVGHKVLVPANTFIATVWGVLYAGATPILCDVEPESGCIDVADAERRITEGVTAIIPVHIYGQPADMAKVMAFAERHRLTVVEDCAQAHGAHFQGRRVGTFGRFGCFSFYPGKNLGAAGEAGAIVTADAQAAERMRCLRNHGQRERYLHDEIGYNYRMEGLQGLVLDHKLRHLDDWTARRKALAARYIDALDGLPLALPRPVHGDHVYHLFVALSPERDALRHHLDAQGIQTGLHYPVPIHRQPCLSGLDI
ncbi:MAG: DegT/DnrJ/EryC1/StrS family aminotransferase, partial [Rhodospirillales bacterium]|nr:DegT/DnrJ/EryC1/StrS family aminotransferase [Rhodospirillales bacterium]